MIAVVLFLASAACFYYGANWWGIVLVLVALASMKDVFHAFIKAYAKTIDEDEKRKKKLGLKE